jgi:hypothetical protein
MCAAACVQTFTDFKEGMRQARPALPSSTTSSSSSAGLALAGPEEAAAGEPEEEEEWDPSQRPLQPSAALAAPSKVGLGARAAGWGEGVEGGGQQGLPDGVRGWWRVVGRGSYGWRVVCQLGRVGLSCHSVLLSTALWASSHPFTVYTL